MAGAAHLLHINAGVLRQAQIEQKSIVEHKGKSLLDSRSSVPIHGVKAWPNDPLVSFVQGTKPEVTEKLPRSEEHTSELQSLVNLVCRLLLEKKNKKQKRKL